MLRCLRQFELNVGLSNFDCKACVFAAALCATILLSQELSFAQILSQPSTRQAKNALENPAVYSAFKERALIREIMEPELILRLEPGQSKIIRTNYPITRTATNHPDIVDFNPFDSYEVEVFGKTPGESTLSFWYEVPSGGVHILRYHVQVSNEQEKQRKRESRVKRLQLQVNELFPNSQVFLIPVEDKVIVRGQARDSKEAFEIMQLLGQSRGNPYVGNNSRFGNGNNIFGNFGANSGYSSNFFANQQLAIGQNPDGADRSLSDDFDDVSFINMMSVPGEQQVMLKVRIAELNRSSNRSMGFDFDVMFDGNQISHLISGAGNLTAILSDGDVRFLLSAIASHGYGKILAEPTLVTISGKPARFIAGGEFAVPTAVGVGGVGAASTQFRGFGTELSFTPTITDKDLIRIEVSPSFSTLNSDATVGGIPGLSRRSVDTTVDLREGQWLAIAGLIQDEQGGQRARLPFVGDMPIIGGLFGHSDTSRQETELVVLVSPELVHPLEAEQVPLLLPGMNITDPTDDDFFLRHQTQGYEGFDHRSTAFPERAAQLGGYRRQVILDHLKPRVSRRIKSQQAYVTGPSGFSK